MRAEKGADQRYPEDGFPGGVREAGEIVVALYEAENQRIARWQEREERLKSPELLERLGQLAEENDRLEADFIKEL